MKTDRWLSALCRMTGHVIPVNFAKVLWWDKKARSGFGDWSFRKEKHCKRCEVMLEHKPSPPWGIPHRKFKHSLSQRFAWRQARRKKP